MKQKRGFCRLFCSLCFCVLVWQLILPVHSDDAALAEKPIAEQWSSAISNDNVNELEVLLSNHVKQGGNAKELIQRFASNGKSALMVASKVGDLEFVKELISIGAPVDEKTVTGGTPFMFAVLGDHVKTAQWLYSEGASINAQGSNGWSAATIAGAKGQSDMMRWLISTGADIDSPDVYRFTPLMRAVDNQHISTVKVLLEQGKVRVDSVDEAENTALHFAVAHQHIELIQLLMKHGANPQHANRDGVRAIDIAKPHPAISALLE